MPAQPPAIAPHRSPAPRARPPAPAFPPPFRGYPAAAPLPYRTSGLAVASLLLALGGACTGMLALPAVALGHLALVRMRRDPFLRGRWVARAGLVIGYGTLASWRSSSSESG